MSLSLLSGISLRFFCMSASYALSTKRLSDLSSLLSELLLSDRSDGSSEILLVVSDELDAPSLTAWPNIMLAFKFSGSKSFISSSKCP